MKNEEVIPMALLKAVRKAERAGQAVLRRRGGPHEKKGYQRPQQKDWS